MKKPIIFVVVGGLLLGLLGAGIYIYVSPKNTTSVDVRADSALLTPTPAMTLLTWDDPAGFTMQYPADVNVNTHEEDVVNYAHVELTSTTHPGSVVLWVKDLPKGVTNTVAWGKQAATPSSAISFDTTLGDQPAQKVLISQAPKTTRVGVVYDGVLWIVEATLTDDVYWQRVYDVITKSFAFKPIAGKTQPLGVDEPSGDMNVADEEEILE